MINYKLTLKGKFYMKEQELKNKLVEHLRQPVEVWSRVVGYCRPVNQWNEAKAEEFRDRKVFKIK